MRLLLDTHILHWTFYEESRLPSKARQLMIEANQILISSASLWEMAIKTRIGKMSADLGAVIEKAEASGFVHLPVHHGHTLQVARLPLLHADPFDRMLVAQAMSEQIWLLTSDSQLPQYTDLVLRV